MPSTMCSLNTQLTCAIASTAPGWKVTMRCAQSASTSITLPSRCCPDSGMVASPSASWIHSSHSRNTSLFLVTARMRESPRRRPSSSVSPAIASTPAMPPLAIAITCFVPASRTGA